MDVVKDDQGPDELAAGSVDRLRPQRRQCPIILSCHQALLETPDHGMSQAIPQVPVGLDVPDGSAEFPTLALRDDLVLY